MIDRRRFWQFGRIYPFCAICCVISSIFLLISIVLWFQNRTLTVIQHQKQIEGEAVRATLISAPQLRQELIFTAQTTGRISQNIIADENLAEYVNYFYKMEEHSGARLEEFNPLVVAATDNDSAYRRVPFNLRASGSYAQVAAFIHEIETGARPASITFFSFRRRGPAGSTVALDMNLDMLGNNK